MRLIMVEKEDRVNRAPVSLASLLLSNYSIYPGTILTSILLVEIAESFDTSIGVVSQIRTMSSVLGFVTAIAIGGLSIRYSSRRLLSAGLLLLSLSCLGSAAATNLGLLFVLYSLNGVATNMVFPMLTSLVGEYYSTDGRARVMGWIGASGGLSYMVGAPIIAYLTSTGGWRLPFIVYAATLPIAALVLILWRLPPTPVKAETAGISEGFQTIISTRSALAALGAVALMGASTQSIYFYSFTYLREVHGASQGQVSLIFSAASLAFLLGSFFCGSFVDKMGVKRSLIMALGLAIFFQGTYPYLSLILGGVVIVVGHFFFSLQYSAANTIVLEQVPAYRGSMMSLSSAFSYLGYGLGTAIGGIILTTGGWTSLNLVLSLIGVVAFILYLYLVEV
jgi:predicted MFS family arabinose efflux permease